MQTVKLLVDSLTLHGVRGRNEPYIVALPLTARTGQPNWIERLGVGRSTAARFESMPLEKIKSGDLTEFDPPLCLYDGAPGAHLTCNVAVMESDNGFRRVGEIISIAQSLLKRAQLARYTNGLPSTGLAVMLGKRALEKATSRLRANNDDTLLDEEITLLFPEGAAHAKGAEEPFEIVGRKATIVCHVEFDDEEEVEPEEEPNDEPSLAADSRTMVRDPSGFQTGEMIETTAIAKWGDISKGDEVKIVDGDFEGEHGLVKKIDKKGKRVRGVIIDIIGGEVPIPPVIISKLKHLHSVTREPLPPVELPPADEEDGEGAGAIG